MGEKGVKEKINSIIKEVEKRPIFEKSVTIHIKEVNMWGEPIPEVIEYLKKVPSIRYEGYYYVPIDEINMKKKNIIIEISVSSEGSVGRVLWEEKE